MTERALRGFAAAPGLAAGPAVLLTAPAAAPHVSVPLDQRRAQLECASSALEETAGELERIAARLRDEARDAEAEIVESNALMARDPGLGLAVERLVLEQGRPAVAALAEAAESFAGQLAALPDPMLAERADDVRSLGRRAAARAAGAQRTQRGGVLIAAGLGPADVAELGPEVRGIALAAGGVTAHAAIVARSLGLPMAVGLGPELLDVADGETVVLDGSRGELIRCPDASRLEAAQADGERRRKAREKAIAERQEPAATRDGRRVRVLANATSVAEIREALEQGAEGVGLLRTELLFLDAPTWPDEERHYLFLRPLLAALASRTATIRLLDFGADKTPPFLAGCAGRGVELLLAAPQALRAQLAAILRATQDAEVRILVPMVTQVDQVDAVRELLNLELRGRPAPALGAMIETPEAARNATELARRLDFLSLGTNDLIQLTLGLDRESSGTSPLTHPRVLPLVEGTVRAAHAAGIAVEVCGEAASDPAMIRLLVGLGVDELSVGAARVGEVRELVRDLDYRSLLDQAGHAGGQRV
jgi:phosphoenolpyruvate-protein kinase (PTS system EI component)